MGVSGVGLGKLIFACAILGESGGGLWISTRYLAIVHVKMGVSGVRLVKPILRA